jgi:hypothetical protein
MHRKGRQPLPTPPAEGSGARNGQGYDTALQRQAPLFWTLR